MLKVASQKMPAALFKFSNCLFVEEMRILFPSGVLPSHFKKGPSSLSDGSDLVRNVELFGVRFLREAMNIPALRSEGSPYV